MGVENEIRSLSRPTAGDIHNPRTRIAVLDAFRGIAVLWVMLFHFAFFWTPAGEGENLLPYDDALAGIPLADVGSLGVRLFFLISGYIIPLTLERTSTLSDFAIKRIARLWPPLLVCGTLTFVVAHLIGPPLLQVSISEFLISVLFLPPQHVGLLLDATDWQWLDGAYWSLWVEVRFYLVIGVCFFLFRKNWLILWGVFESVAFLALIAYHATGHAAFDFIEGLLFSYYVPYFTLGIVCYLFHSGRFDRTAQTVGALALFHLAYAIYLSVSEFSLLSAIAGYGVVAGLFAAFAFSPGVLKIIEARPLIGLGRASYSLYLLHQVIGVSLIGWIARFIQPQWSALSAIFATAILIAAARAMFHFVEKPANKAIVVRLIPKRA